MKCTQNFPQQHAHLKALTQVLGPGTNSNLRGIFKEGQANTKKNAVLLLACCEAPFIYGSHDDNTSNNINLSIIR